MCDDCTLQSEPNRCKKCYVECYNKLEFCNECNIDNLVNLKNNPYPQAEKNKTKPKEEGIVNKIFGSLFSKNEKKAKVEPCGHQNDKADLFCRDCRKVVQFTRVKEGNKMWPFNFSNSALSSSKLDKSIWVQTGYLSEVLQEIGESLTL